ncbi:hypothetical protein [Streptomyces sp. NPDC046332]|uniref:hypothetical protein n=1 Tax=Streptomyces sp. NPDC046332 TaxID=3155133 RepID=UPI0033C5FDF1
MLAGSYGSAIAYEIARRHPDRVGRMVLVGTMTAIPDHAQVAMRRLRNTWPPETWRRTRTPRSTCS